MWHWYRWVSTESLHKWSLLQQWRKLHLWLWYRIRRWGRTYIFESYSSLSSWPKHFNYRISYWVWFSRTVFKTFYMCDIFILVFLLIKIELLPLSFAGNLCDIDTDECLLIPCINGHCLNNEGSFSCDCYTGFEGEDEPIYLQIFIFT